MFKVAYVTRFRPGMDRFAASDHWTYVHAPMADPVAHEMTTYIQSHVRGSVDPLGGDPDQVAFDGYSSEYWTDRTVFEQCMRSQLWSEIVADGPKVFDLGSMDGMSTVLRERAVVDGPRLPFKLTWFVRLSDGGGEQWLDGSAAAVNEIPGVGRQLQNVVTASIGMEGIVDAPAAYDGFEEWWFADQAAARAALDSPEWARMRDARGAYADYDALPGHRAVIEERTIRDAFA